MRGHLSPLAASPSHSVKAASEPLSPMPGTKKGSPQRSPVAGASEINPKPRVFAMCKGASELPAPFFFFFFFFFFFSGLCSQITCTPPLQSLQAEREHVHPFPPAPRISLIWIKSSHVPPSVVVASSPCCYNCSTGRQTGLFSSPKVSPENVSPDFGQGVSGC